MPKTAILGTFFGDIRTRTWKWICWPWISVPQGIAHILRPNLIDFRELALLTPLFFSSPYESDTKKRGNDIFYKHHNFSNLVQNFDEKSFRLGCLCFLFQNWGLSPFFCSKCQMIGVDCTSAHSNPLKGFSSPMAITYLTHSGHEYAIPGSANGGGAY